MVVRTETCAFSELKVYPGHGRRFVTRSGQMVILGGSKVDAMYHQRKKSAKLMWTQVRARSGQGGRGAAGSARRGVASSRARGAERGRGRAVRPVCAPSLPPESSPPPPSCPPPVALRPALPLAAQAWRRMHKKINVEASSKRRVRKVIKDERFAAGVDKAKVDANKAKAAAAKEAAKAKPVVAEGAKAEVVKQASVADAKAKKKAMQEKRKKTASAGPKPVAAAKHAGKGR